MRKIPCLVIILLFFLSSILPVVNSIYIEKNNNGLENSLDNGLMDSAWPMQSHDARHTGRSPYSTQNVTGVEKWRFKTDSVLWGSPIIAKDGTIYVGTLNGKIYAINPNGTLRWKGDLGGFSQETFAIADDGTIYIASMDCNLYAINTSEGKPKAKWKFHVADGGWSSPSIAQDGTIYVTTTGHGLYAVNPNGTLKWHYNHGHCFSEPAIGQDGTIYYGDFFHSIIYAINPDGTEKWNFTARINIRGSASIGDDGTVYIEAGGELYAFNPDNGTVIWKTPVGLTNHCPAIDKNGIIYVGEGSGRMDQFYAFYPNNGTIKWSFDPGNGSAFWKSSAAISADGTVYIGTIYDYWTPGFGGEIIALNSDDGSVRWRKFITSRGYVESSPCIGADGTVYISSIQTRPITWGEYVNTYGYVHAFGPVTSNKPPDTPKLYVHPIHVIDSVNEYFINVTAVDPDMNPVSYYVDWGDNTTELTEQYASYEEAFLYHKYAKTGTYTIRVKAMDEFGGESNRSSIKASEIQIHYYLPILRFIRYFFIDSLLPNNDIFQPKSPNLGADQKSTYNSMAGVILTSPCTYAQSFTPNENKLTAVKLQIFKHGTNVGLNSITVSIRDNLTGADLTTKTVDVRGFGTLARWVLFDFEDITVTPGKKYYILCSGIYGNDNNAYCWMYTSGYDGSKYKRGETWIKPSEDTDWIRIHYYDENYYEWFILPADFCFITYFR